MITDAPELQGRAVDIIGLYLHPLQHAAVFSVDERTTIKVPDQLNGGLSLSAALGMGVGEAANNTASPHTPAEFNAFLADIVASQPRGKEIYVVADNVSAHRTVRVDEYLRTHRTVHLQFFPSYSAWLIELELWISKIDRDTDDLKEKLMHHIRQCSGSPKTVKWKYFDPLTRSSADFGHTVH